MLIINVINLLGAMEIVFCIRMANKYIFQDNQKWSDTGTAKVLLNVVTVHKTNTDYELLFLSTSLSSFFNGAAESFWNLILILL